MGPDGVNERNIADGAGLLLDDRGNRVIAFSAETNRPFHRGILPDFRRPFGADL